MSKNRENVKSYNKTSVTVMTIIHLKTREQPIRKTSCTSCTSCTSDNVQCATQHCHNPLMNRKQFSYRELNPKASLMKLHSGFLESLSLIQISITHVPVICFNIILIQPFVFQVLSFEQNAVFASYHHICVINYKILDLIKLLKPSGIYMYYLLLTTLRFAHKVYLSV
jgi:hypothetical protein